jgi:hypothetical protein
LSELPATIAACAAPLRRRTMKEDAAIVLIIDTPVARRGADSPAAILYATRHRVSISKLHAKCVTL